MMGDNSHSCRGFETPTLANDLWPMGFDVDLALDGPGARKGTLASSGLGGGGLNALQSGNSGGAGGYNDIHHLSSLSSIWQRFDDLQAGDICQMTDLTNSLPKGDSETAQSLLAKLAGQDLGPDLSAGADASHKELESSLFGQAQGIHGATANGQGITLSHKTQLESADIYGRMTCYGGKLVLQLRHSNLNANYTLNVSECWLCGEKVTAGSQLCTHKHSFNGVFQVNDEFIQMDIDHYIPEQTLDPQDGQDMADTVLQHSDSSGMHHDLSGARELELPENIAGGGDALGMGGGGPGLHYGTAHDPNLVPPLSSANIMSSSIPTNQSPCLNTSFGQLQLPGMPLTNNHGNLSSGMPGMVDSANLNSAQPLCSASTPVFGLSHNDASSTNALLTSGNQRKMTVQASQTSLANNYTMGNSISNFNMNNQMNSVSVPNQPTQRDIANRNKHSLQYHLPFSVGGDYPCHTITSLEVEAEKNAELPCLTPLHTVPVNQDAHVQRTDTTSKKTEIGAKKRKSRAQRKPSVIQMRECKNDTVDSTSVKTFYAETENSSIKPYKIEPLDDTSVKNFNVESRQGARPDASIEDWIRHSLPEGDLIVSDNQMKPIGDTEDKIQEIDLKGNDTAAGRETLERNSKHLDRMNSTEAEQTSQLAAHMLAKGIDLSCRVCSKEFEKDIKNYKMHMKEHGIDESSLFACSFCPKTFAKGKHYTQHLKTHIITQRVSCKLCSASYSRKAKLRRHMLTHSQENQIKKHKCSKCPKAFTTKEYLQAHLKVHVGKKYKCDACGFLCSSLYNLETHKKKHLGDKPFKCELCEKTFVRRDFLDSHMEQVHKNKKSKCEKCGKLFSRKDVLKRHLAVHNNETYDCEICQKKFSRKDRLASHKKSHKMKCDYKCSLCPASFTRKNVLDKHEKNHKTKEQCKECYKFLPSKQKLEVHMRLHEKNHSKEDGQTLHKCEICEKSLASKDILRKHMRRIHGKCPEPKKKVEAVEREKRFFCQWCSKGFTRSCNLSTHLLKAHSKDSEDDFDDDLPSVLQSSRYDSGPSSRSSNSGNPSSALSFTTSYHGLPTSPSNGGTAGANQIIGSSSSGLPFPVSLPASSPTSSHPPPPLCLSSSSFSNTGRPESPINLSTEAITAAAYLLAYPSYPGPY